MQLGRRPRTAKTPRCVSTSSLGTAVQPRQLTHDGCTQNPALRKRTLTRLTHVNPMLNAATAVAINTAVVAGANAFGVQVAGDLTNGFQSGRTQREKVRWGWGSSGRMKKQQQQQQASGVADARQPPTVVQRTCCGTFFGQLGVIAQLMRHRHPWCSLNSRKGVLGRTERMMLFAVSFFVSLAVLALQYDVVRCVSWFLLAVAWRLEQLSHPCVVFQEGAAARGNVFFNVDINAVLINSSVAACVSQPVRQFIAALMYVDRRQRPSISK